MTTLTVYQNSLTTIEGQALTRFDELAARFLATRKSEATRRTYSRTLADYRALAENLGLDPFGTPINREQFTEIQCRTSLITRSGEF